MTAPRCLYCGGDVATSNDDEWWAWCVDCNCGGSGPYRKTEAEAIAAFCGTKGDDDAPNPD